MLLNVHNLDSIEFATKTGIRPVLSSLFITPTHTVATDSYCLIEVETPNIGKESSLPAQLYSAWPREASDFILMPGNAVRKAIKNIPKKPTLPILSNVSIESTVLDDGKIEASMKTYDGETTDRVDTPTIPGKYPEYKNIFPTEKPKASVRINASYLLKMAQYIKNHCKDDSTYSMILELHGDTSPIVCRSETSEGQKIMGLIMPLRPQFSPPIE